MLTQVRPHLLASHRAVRGTLNVDASFHRNRFHLGNPLAHHDRVNADSAGELSTTTVVRSDVIDQMHTDGIISETLVKINSDSPRHKISDQLSNGWMGTAAENRRIFLKLLITHFKSTAALNRALGRSDRDATLGQYATGAKDSKTGKPRQMGEKFARAIEAKLGWERGRMDGPFIEPLFRQDTRVSTGPHSPGPAPSRDSHENDVVELWRQLLPTTRERVYAELKNSAESDRNIAQEAIARYQATQPEAKGTDAGSEKVVRLEPKMGEGHSRKQAAPPAKKQQKKGN